MARGFLEFRERKGLGRSPFKKPRVFEAVLLSAFSHLGEVCRPVNNSVAFWVKFVKHWRWIIRLVHKLYRN